MTNVVVLLIWAVVSVPVALLLGAVLSWASSGVPHAVDLPRTAEGRDERPVAGNIRA